MILNDSTQIKGLSYMICYRFFVRPNRKTLTQVGNPFYMPSDGFHLKANSSKALHLWDRASKQSWPVVLFCVFFGFAPLSVVRSGILVISDLISRGGTGFWYWCYTWLANPGCNHGRSHRG